MKKIAEQHKFQTYMNFFISNRITKLAPLKITYRQTLMKIGMNYLIIIILKTILKYMIHYQIKNFYSLEKLPKTNLTLISKIK